MLWHVCNAYPDSSVIGEKHKMNKGHARNSVQSDILNTLLVILAKLAYGQACEVPPNKGHMNLQRLALLHDNDQRTVHHFFVVPALRDMLASLDPEFSQCKAAEFMNVESLLSHNLGGKEVHLFNKLKRYGCWSSQHVYHRLRNGVNNQNKSIPGWNRKAHKVTKDNTCDIKGLECTLFCLMQQHSKKFLDFGTGNFKEKVLQCVKRNLLDEDQAKFGTDFDPNANTCVRCMEDDGDDGSGSDEDSE